MTFYSTRDFKTETNYGTNYLKENMWSLQKKENLQLFWSAFLKDILMKLFWHCAK